MELHAEARWRVASVAKPRYHSAAVSPGETSSKSRSTEDLGSGERGDSNGEFGVYGVDEQVGQQTLLYSADVFPIGQKEVLETLAGAGGIDDDIADAEGGLGRYGTELGGEVGQSDAWGMAGHTFKGGVDDRLLLVGLDEGLPENPARLGKIFQAGCFLKFLQIAEDNFHGRRGGQQLGNRGLYAADDRQGQSTHRGVRIPGDASLLEIITADKQRYILNGGGSNRRKQTLYLGSQTGTGGPIDRPIIGVTSPAYIRPSVGTEGSEISDTSGGQLLDKVSLLRTPISELIFIAEAVAEDTEDGYL